MSSPRDAAEQFRPLSSGDAGLDLWRHVPGDWRRPEAAEAYDIYRRESDGFGQILPRPAPDCLAAFYDLDDYYTHRPKQESQQSGGLHWRILQHIAWRWDMGTELDPQWWNSTLGTARMRCLEVGCGSGNTLNILKTLGHHVIGVEPDPQARAVASEKSISVYDGSAETLPGDVTAQPFDCIIFLHVLEHCTDPVLAIENAWDCLADGGLLVVEVPNNGCAGARVFREAWYWLDVPRHLNFFTKRSLTSLIASAGFEVFDHQYRGYCRQFSETWRQSHRKIHATLKTGRQSGFTDYIRLLVRTLFAPADLKYDSIRILARKPRASLDRAPNVGTATSGL